MVLRSLIFALAAYGIMMVIAFLVAVMIKVISVIVQWGDNRAAGEKQS